MAVEYKIDIITALADLSLVVQYRIDYRTTYVWIQDCHTCTCTLYMRARNIGVFLPNLQHILTKEICWYSASLMSNHNNIIHPMIYIFGICITPQASDESIYPPMAGSIGVMEWTKSKQMCDQNCCRRLS